MNLSIRIKFFIIILAFSLGPMLLSRTLMGKQGAKMAGRISDETRSEMTEIINADLESNAIGFLNFLNARGQNIEFAAHMLAQQAANILNSNEKPEPSELFYASNFAPGGKMPADVAPSEHYVRKLRNGKTNPIEISMEQAAFRIPHDATGENVEEEAHRLNSILPTLKVVYRELEADSAWLNVGLESGVFSTYPGHGFFPMRFDHRHKPWYHEARKKQDDAAWTVPYIDPATRATIASASYPIHDRDGVFIGAVSVDVPVSEIISEVSLKSRWSDQIESFMVKYMPEDANHEERLLILAQHEYDNDRRRHRMSLIEAESMTSDDSDGLKALIKRITTEASGVVNLPYKGRDCVWAFASNEDFSFLLIAPQAVMAELPNEMASTVEDLFAEIRNISSIVYGITLVLVGLIAWFGSRAFSKPLLAMADTAKQLAGGDFTARMDMHTGDERDEVINAFNDMVPKLEEHLALSRDMELAHEVQNMLLPRSEPTLAGFDLAGKIEFCDQTGGDYYDFIKMHDDGGKALGVALGDVSGHGVPSALVMSTTRGQLHSLANSPLTPKGRIQSINTVLSRDLDGSGRFLTLFYLRLRENDPVVHWVRAGHDPAIRYNPATDEFSELCGDGLALGVLEEYDYEDYEATLEAGEVLTMATDGVWEARNADGEMFGKDRVLAIIRDNAHYGAEAVRAAIMNGVAEFQASQEDDIAVVVVKKVADMSEQSIAFRMTNKENCFKCFQPKVEAFCEANSLSKKVVFHLTLVLDELVTNIIDYGYADFDVHPIDVTLTLDDDQLTIRVEDDAQPFNILDAPEPELDVPLEDRDRQVGGMGVHLVKSMVNGIRYERNNDKNILTLTKNLSEGCCATCSD